MSATASSHDDGTGEIMGSIDAEEYVIADVSTDDAWVSIRVAEAPDIRDWR